MIRFADKETGEIIDNIYQDKEGFLKTITYKKRNYVFRETDDGKVELCFFSKPFAVPESEYITNSDDELVAFESYNVRRHWKNVNGVAIKIDEEANFSDFCANCKKGNIRAQKTFFDYALANTWEYWVTLTFEDKDVRNDYNLMGVSWRSFTNTLKIKFPDFKALAVYETFKKGGYHLHALLSDCDLTLVPARNNNVDSTNYGKFVYSEFGPQIFNCTDWKLGFNTVCCITPDSCQAQIVNYMSKYMSKESPSNYGCRRFYHTTNCACRHSIVGRAVKKEDLTNMVEKFNLKFVKEDKSGNCYFRNY